MKKINLITQFYKPKNENRFQELKIVLEKNIENIFVNKIYLFYELEELKFEHKKIIWIYNPSRLTFKEAFTFCNENLKNQICIISNSDIIFDKHLKNLYKINLQNICLALLRHEIDQNLNFNYAKPFTMIYNNKTIPRFDSQDCWIFLSPININFEKYNIIIGSAGCDNKIAYLLNQDNYYPWNPYKLIKIYHLHKYRDNYVTYFEENEKYLFIQPDENV
jgi:hypothetical protein